MKNILIPIFFVIIKFSGSKCHLFYTSKTSDQIIVHERLPADGDWVSKGYFNNSINSTGFGYLEIETNTLHDPKDQAFHAGYLEGTLTSQLIYSQWFNVVDFFCKQRSNDCSTLRKFVLKNKEWIEQQAETKRHDPYWYQVNLFHTQLDGICSAYNSNLQLPVLRCSDILLINLLFELTDIQCIIDANKTETKPSASDSSDHCSALIKLMPGNKDVYFGQNTWIDYSVMLRILKKYILPFKTSENSTSTIPGAEMSMSSYPGTLLSIDDFYLVSSGLAVTETTNSVHNKALFKGIGPEGIVWEGIRSMIANRLATDGETWHKIFSQFNSGTCNNQWMVFDYNKFKPGEKLSEGSLWISEQMPGKIVRMDVTDVLNDKGYWSSYNVPYSEEIYRISGYAEKMLEPDGPWFSYTETPRAKLFKRDHATVIDMSSFMKLMRSNDFRNDDLAKCNCSPAYSGKGAIAAREDLNPADGNGMNERLARGAIDAKLTNRELFKKLQFYAVAGPTTGTDNKLPVFRWSTSSFSHIPHLSHPDEFNFEPVLKEWSLRSVFQNVSESV
ncbi:hypothetical protein LSTR_LSTR000887 [Laodelphax striatellus]|uniref:Phospholipase B-like n=1 Tax=Laodelphax striatellus TaxID=195883 RepID=A0A482X1C4_LAOST|nr:hypothetical protein LSTR_LSTR000887 [Laodelphax striatellus]